MLVSQEESPILVTKYFDELFLNGIHWLAPRSEILLLYHYRRIKSGPRKVHTVTKSLNGMKETNIQLDRYCLSWVLICFTEADWLPHHCSKKDIQTQDSLDQVASPQREEGLCCCCCCLLKILQQKYKCYKLCCMQHTGKTLSGFSFLGEMCIKSNSKFYITL